LRRKRMVGDSHRPPRGGEGSITRKEKRERETHHTSTLLGRREPLIGGEKGKALERSSDLERVLGGGKESASKRGEGGRKGLSLRKSWLVGRKGSE